MSKPLIAIASIPFAIVSCNLMLVPIFPLIKAHMSLSSTELSFIVTSFSMAEATALLIVGYLSDRFGRMRIILPSILLFGLGGIITGFSALLDNFWQLILGRILQGFGAAGIMPIAMALVGDLFRGSEGGKALGLMESSGAFAKIISPILGSLMALLTWYSAFFAVPILSLALAVFLRFTVKEERIPYSTSVLDYVDQMKHSLKKKAKWFIPAVLIGTLGTSILLGIPFYLTFVLENQYKISGVAKGICLAVPLLGMVSASFLSGIKIKNDIHFVPKGVLTGLFLLVVSQFCLSLFAELYVVLFLLLVSCIGIGTFLPCVNTYIIKISGSAQRGTMVALYGCFRSLGVACTMPILASTIKGSHTLLFLGSAGICFMAFVFIVFMSMAKRVDLDLLNQEILE